MAVRLARSEDFPSLRAIYAEARLFMASQGNPTQWGKRHPPMSLLKEFYQAQELYVLENEKGPYGAFALVKGEDPAYATLRGEWLSSAPYLTIHALASNGRVKGVFSTVLTFALTQSSHLRIDTHENNALMRRRILEAGFVYVGKCSDGPRERLCYERL